jgi:hypothetical protein
MAKLRPTARASIIASRPQLKIGSATICGRIREGALGTPGDRDGLRLSCHWRRQPSTYAARAA